MSEIRILKRRHDDHDDPDCHEGEKIRRVELETTIGTEPQTTTDPPNIAPSEQRVKSEVDTLEPNGHVFDI